MWYRQVPIGWASADIPIQSMNKLVKNGFRMTEYPISTAVFRISEDPREYDAAIEAGLVDPIRRIHTQKTEQSGQ